MHLLTVFAHPIRESYTGAVMDSFHEPFRESGHTIDLVDLHGEGFDPRFTEADHAHFWGAQVPPDVAEMQLRVEAADRLALIFPVYWWSMPALMKGWIDRVFTGGWAHRRQDEAGSVLPAVPTLLLAVAGSTQRRYDNRGYHGAMRTQIEMGIFNYCGLVDVESLFIYDVEGDGNQTQRAAGLQLARRAGLAFAAGRAATTSATAD
ncbi:NAD(P)H dehydrogenase [Frankia canadensis]|uniref:NAD(P)H dehydrogenase n=1 Tax=Frankia canadensis TaxID=1836972 RepID=A0A2I2KVR6_9ACTN|nr:NAD(P)H-dependent oxidoreductase [Frankia canadensis]SNQ49754.1 NAD(P)H dehydrogenase [Frankia canadensis]SOU57044.1 NAD(P)H dehydrogenase [Frankia canadensis]